MKRILCMRSNCHAQQEEFWDPLLRSEFADFGVMRRGHPHEGVTYVQRHSSELITQVECIP